MDRSNPETPLTQEQRMEVFKSLVEAQDTGVPVVESRNEVVQRFRISEHQVRLIEREGLDGLWPPLNVPQDCE
jgi:hypothetical protein